MHTIQNIRDSNIELLRIFSMIFIVMHHFSVHGGFIIDGTFSFNKYVLECLFSGGKLGVDIFVLISGYFLVNLQFNIKKITKLIIQIWIYSFTISILFISFHGDTFSLSTIRHFVPIYSNYWFAYTYIILYIIFPILNIVIHTIDQNKYNILLFVGFILWSLLPTFFHAHCDFSNLIWFIYLYFIGAYFRKYDIHNLCTFINNKNALVLITILTFIYIYCYFCHYSKVLSTYHVLFLNMNSPIILISSCLFFLVFKELDIGYVKMINVVSSTTFGIYLIHDNCYIRSFLWKEVFKNATWQYNEYLIFYSLFVILIVFIGCSLIEFLRIQIIDRKIIDKLLDNQS